MLIVTLLLFAATIYIFVAYRNQYRACEMLLHAAKLSEDLSDLTLRHLITKLGSHEAAKDYVQLIYYEFSTERSYEIFNSLAASLGWTEEVSFWDEGDMRRLANDLAASWKKQYRVK